LIRCGKKNHVFVGVISRTRFKFEHNLETIDGVGWADFNLTNGTMDPCVRLMGHAEDDTVWDDVSNEVWEASHHSLIPLNQIAASERTKVIRINPYHRLGREIYQTHNEITKKIT